MESAKQKYLNSLKALCPSLTDADLEQFASLVTIKELKKKDFLVESEKTQSEIGYIVTGLVRSFYIDKNGDEITVGFYPEGEYAAHFDSFVKQKPCKYSIQCLEDTTFVCVSLENLRLNYERSNNFERYGRLVAEGILIGQQNRIESFIFQTAEERYLDFIKKYPGLFNRISLSHLCSFLGIERQTLTRIRHKLAHQ